jgi:hypothetical protein
MQFQVKVELPVFSFSVWLAGSRATSVPKNIVSKRLEGSDLLCWGWFVSTTHTTLRYGTYMYYKQYVY